MLTAAEMLESSNRINDSLKVRQLMGKPKRKLTTAQKAAKRRRRREFMTIFINGKQKRIKRPPTIEGMSVDEFTLRNADPIGLQQNEMWEYMQPEEAEGDVGFKVKKPKRPSSGLPTTNEELPF